MNTTRAQRQRLKTENKKQSKTLTRTSFLDKCDSADGLPRRFAVWRSRDFLVQGFFEENNTIRLSVNRATINESEWAENITWEELQEVKRQAGYGDYQAVEIYPKEKHIVNVANMRHLWIFNDELNIGWKSEK